LGTLRRWTLHFRTVPASGLQLGAPHGLALARHASQNGQHAHLADATEERLPAGVQMRVLLGDEAALLPDLESIEVMIGDALAAVA